MGSSNFWQETSHMVNISWNKIEIPPRKIMQQCARTSSIRLPQDEFKPEETLMKSTTFLAFATKITLSKHSSIQKATVEKVPKTHQLEMKDCQIWKSALQ